MAELVVCGNMFVNGRLQYMEAAVDGGKITEVAKSIRGGERRIDAGTSGTIMPGFIDPHVHLRDPGMTHKETFSTGTLSAVCGGVTCVLDMPNTKPPVTDISTLQDKKAHVKGRAYTDYGLYAALTAGSKIEQLAPHIPSFKLFMGSTTGNILLNDDEEIAPLMEKIAATGVPLSVHAEDDSLISKEPESCCQDHLRNRPVEAEFSAIRRLSRYPGVRINICHCTNAEQVRMASAAGFSTEVTMHHLLLDTQKMTDAFGKVNPPLRTKDQRLALFEEFLKGTIKMFGSDHAPHTVDEKEKEFGEAPGGIPGVETTIPMAMRMAAAGTLSLQQVADMGSANAAGWFRLNKGSIEPGKDADFAIFDMRKICRIEVPRLHSKCGWSPFAGMEAVFPDTVIIGGNVAVEDGEPIGDPVGRDVRERIHHRLFRNGGTSGRVP